MARDIKTPDRDHPFTITRTGDHVMVRHVAFYSDRVELSVEAADGAED